MRTREKMRQEEEEVVLSGIPPFSPLQLLPSHLSGFQGLSELEEVPDLENRPTMTSTANGTNE